MPCRDILAITTAAESDTAVLACAERLARTHNAFLTTLLVQWIPAMSAVVEGWVVDARWGELVEEARGTMERDRAALEKRFAGSLDRSAVLARMIEPGAAQSVAGLFARHADLSIVSRPQKTLAEARTGLLEGALFGSGRPVMVVPPTWADAPIGKTVFLAWNAEREAARALADALPLLDPSARIVVATVDAKPTYEGHGDLPGYDISTHLARHGFKVELRNIDGMGKPDSKALLEAAGGAGADLIVMGGYGRSRLSEMVFGGVTREMLTRSDIPILMSH
jgi:nucleotide-binding universal stress UspA family protein